MKQWQKPGNIRKSCKKWLLEHDLGSHVCWPSPPRERMMPMIGARGAYRPILAASKGFIEVDSVFWAQEPHQCTPQ
jgi:hypothetical protein